MVDIIKFKIIFVYLPVKPGKPPPFLVTKFMRVEGLTPVFARSRGLDASKLKKKSV